MMCAANAAYSEGRPSRGGKGTLAANDACTSRGILSVVSGLDNAQTPQPG